MNEIIFETDVQPDRTLHLPEDLPIGAHVRVMIKPLPTMSTRRGQLADREPDTKLAPFPVTEFESPTTGSVYQGQPLTLQQMREAIDWEAEQR